jgi:hypothetical protein
MARSGHGLPKVSPRPFYALKRPYGRFRGDPPAGQPTAMFYPFGHPSPYAYAFQTLVLSLPFVSDSSSAAAASSPFTVTFVSFLLFIDTFFFFMVSYKNEATSEGQVIMLHAHHSHHSVIHGKFRDQGDAKWIVIRGQLRGHNDASFMRPTPGRLIGHPGVGYPQGVINSFSYY